MIDQNSKSAIRQEARARRQRVEGRDALGRKINEKLITTDSFRLAKRLLLYVDMHDEVQTRDAIQVALLQEKEVFVPYCEGEDLRLFRLYDPEELSPGAFGILEPKLELRTITKRHAQVDQMDLIVVPGVAFDRIGNRMGHGRGYYDRLLGPIATLPINQRPYLIGLAFECQLFDFLPSEPHDIKMDYVIIP